MATGGAQKVLLDQARWFHKNGHHVCVVFFYDKEGFHEKWQGLFDFPILNLNAFHREASVFNNILSLIRAMALLWKMLHESRFDVVETFTHDSNMLALPFAWLADVPVRIATHHGVIDGFSKWRGKLHAWLVNSRMVSVLVTVSEMTRQKAIDEGVRTDRIVVIQNGIEPISFDGLNRPDVRKEIGLNDNDNFLVSVGRLVYQKAHEVLVSAMPVVLAEFPNVKLGICGDGVLRPQLEKQIRDLGLQENIKLLGKWDNVARFLLIADLFILPSRWEGLPIALLEAMSAGLPVVATRVEGVDEVILDGEHGFLVPVENPSALAQAILQLLWHPQLGKKMGSACRNRLQKMYSIDRMAERYLSLMVEENNRKFRDNR